MAVCSRIFGLTRTQHLRTSCLLYMMRCYSRKLSDFGLEQFESFRTSVEEKTQAKSQASKLAKGQGKGKSQSKMRGASTAQRGEVQSQYQAQATNSLEEDEFDLMPQLSLNVESIKMECKFLREQNAKLSRKYKKLLAENENLLKRCNKQVAEAKRFGIQQFCKDIVEVADVLGSATASIPKMEIDSGGQYLQHLYKGLLLTQEYLLQVFKRHGVETYNPVNEKFDPNYHQALYSKEKANVEPNTVIEVTKLGYKLEKRCIRPALVGISKDQ